MHDPLWAPWRMQYLERLDADQRAGRGGLDDFIATAFATPDADDTNHVIHRDDHGLVMLNRYPYANGPSGPWWSLAWPDSEQCSIRKGSMWASTRARRPAPACPDISMPTWCPDGTAT